MPTLPQRELFGNFVDPVTQMRLSESDGYLVSADGDARFPIIAGTPILHPDPEAYLVDEYMALTRVIAEFGVQKSPQTWLANVPFNPPEGLPQDTEIRGEGYPGFWDHMPIPAYLVPLTSSDATTLIGGILGSRFRGLGLDLGCGQGGMTQLMSQSCERVIGIEQNLYLATLANHLLRADKIDIPYFDPCQGWKQTVLSKPAVNNALVSCATVYALPFSEPLFDWIHCGHLLDLLVDPEQVIDAILRILKPGAVLSIVSPRDYESAQHFDDLTERLNDHFESVHEQDDLTYIRWNHRRRFVVQSDWLWIGKLR
ncbi:MAG: class I SAM-dependent methyltransferase [Acidobacteria bacterium]|nr:class I SAM-dependent methyltransferase [Acidobacteriota bacterium]MCB9399708.1 class I SAM-dependent methyltransferase [Acidobacteriota bacterium]